MRIFDLPSYTFFPCSVLSCLVLACLVLFYFVLCCSVLSSLVSFFQIAYFESPYVLRLCQHRSFSTLSPYRKEKARKVEFDFDAIQVLGLKFDLPKGGAAKIGAKSGLGSDSNEDLVEKGSFG